MRKIAKRKKKGRKTQPKYSKIKKDSRHNQWNILELIHYNYHGRLKRPMKLNARKIGDHLDIPASKVTSHIRELRRKKIIAPKKLRITKEGFKTKRSYERKYDPSP